MPANRFKKLDQKLENYSLPKLAGLLGFISLLFILLGTSSAVLISNKLQDLEEKAAGNLEISREERESEEALYEGTIIPLSENEETNATHSLNNEENKVIALLSATDDKLTLSEGATVKVDGKIVKQGADRPPLILVERIVFE